MHSCVPGFFISQKGNMNASIDTNLEHLRGVLRLHKPKQPTLLQRSPKLTHGWLLPCLLAADEFLWQRWRHWFETMTERRIIAPIPRIEWARNEAGCKMLNRSLSAISKYGDYAPWLVRPFPFLDTALTDPAQSPEVSESMARQAPAQLHCTEHDAAMQWQFEPIKKRRQSAESAEAVEQGALLLGF